MYYMTNEIPLNVGGRVYLPSDGEISDLNKDHIVGPYKKGVCFYIEGIPSFVKLYKKNSNWKLEVKYCTDRRKKDHEKIVDDIVWLKKYMVDLAFWLKGGIQEKRIELEFIKVETEDDLN